MENNLPVLGSSVSKPKIIIRCHHLLIFRDETTDASGGRGRRFVYDKYGVVKKLEFT